MKYLKRTLEMKVRFTKDELDTLTKKARKAGLSREGYCRRILDESVVKAAPTADVPMLIREVRRVGNNINQLLLLSRANGWLNSKELEKALDSNRAVEKRIIEAYATDPD